MKRVFIDTNGWIALNSKRDQFHEAAVKLNKELLQKGSFYVTTNYVLDETYTGLLTKVGHFAAIDFGKKIRASKLIMVVHISEKIEEETWHFFQKHSDKGFSFTDCTSFVVMRRFNLTEAFTNDHHFVQAGFTILLEKLNLP
jgi:predicted nucleic acid-binding protein